MSNPLEGLKPDTNATGGYKLDTKNLFIIALILGGAFVLYTMLLKHKTTAAADAAAANTPAPANISITNPAAPPVAPNDHPGSGQEGLGIYQVKPHDTAGGIARWKGISVERLYVLNKQTIDSWAIANQAKPDPTVGYANYVYPGQILTIPLNPQAGGIGIF